MPDTLTKSETQRSHEGHEDGKPLRAFLLSERRRTSPAAPLSRSSGTLAPPEALSSSNRGKQSASDLWIGVAGSLSPHRGES